MADSHIRGTYDGSLYRIVDPESFGADPILEDNFDSFNMPGAGSNCLAYHFLGMVSFSCLS